MHLRIGCIFARISLERTQFGIRRQLDKQRLWIQDRWLLARCLGHLFRNHRSVREVYLPRTQQLDMLPGSASAGHAGEESLLDVLSLGVVDGTLRQHTDWLDDLTPVSGVQENELPDSVLQRIVELQRVLPRRPHRGRPN